MVCRVWVPIPLRGFHWWRGEPPVDNFWLRALIKHTGCVGPPTLIKNFICFLRLWRVHDVGLGSGNVRHMLVKYKGVSVQHLKMLARIRREKSSTFSQDFVKGCPNEFAWNLKTGCSNCSHLYNNLNLGAQKLITFYIIIIDLLCQYMYIALYRSPKGVS